MALHPYNREAQQRARERAKVAARLRDQGRTWEEVGIELGVSRQRAQYIVAKYRALGR